MRSLPRDLPVSHADGKAVTRALLLLAMANFAVWVWLGVAKPQANGFAALGRCLRGQIGSDSSYFMDLAFHLAQSTRPLYPTLVQQQHKKFQYPTSSLLIGYVGQAMHLSMHTLLAWVVVISALLTLWFAGEIFLLLMPGEGAYRWQARALIALLGLFFYPLVDGAALGQVQTLLTFLFTVAVWFWIRDRKASAGIALAVACAFKPPLALFLLWGLVRKQWRFVWAFLAVAVALQLLAILAFGWQHDLEYVAALSYLSRHGESIPENQSVNGFLQRLTNNGNRGPALDYFWYPPYNAVVYFGTLLSTAVLLAFALVVPVWRRWRDPLADFVLFGLVSTIASPIVWTHHYGVFYAGCVYFLAVSLRQSARIPVAFVVCYLLLANFIQFFSRYAAVPAVNWVYSYVLYAGLGLVLLIAFRLPHNDTPADTPTGSPGV